MLCALEPGMLCMYEHSCTAHTLCTCTLKRVASLNKPLVLKKTRVYCDIKLQTIEMHSLQCPLAGASAHGI